MNEEIQLLKDPEAVLTSEYLEEEFGATYPIYQGLVTAIESEPFGLNLEWKYYKDGKAWLCRISRKKKTVAWLSAWPGYLKFGFYFTNKSGKGIPDLDIGEDLKESYQSHEPTGKLKPLVVELRSDASMDDLLTLIAYKVSVL